MAVLDALLRVGSAAAGVPLFHTPPVFSPFGLTNVVADNAPAAADLDADGDLDFLVGDYDGNTSYFANQGSASAPAFAPPLLNAFGLIDVGDHAAPTFGDVDGDGVIDVIIGDLIGDLRYFHNSGTSSAPSFAAPVVNPFGLTNSGAYAAPYLVDIDADGDLDLFVGINTGGTSFFRNIGTAMAPVFGAAELNPFGLSSVTYTATPTFSDIDGDGLLDAIIGDGDGAHLFFFRNRGSASAPLFASPQIDPFGLAYPIGSDARPLFADIDDDGFIDAFVGNFAGYLFFYAGEPRLAPAPALSPAALLGALALLGGVAFAALRRRGRH